jgi:hypothetical protein
MRRAHSILVVAGVAALLGGCALLNRKGDPADASSQMVTVVIDNQNFYDATAKSWPSRFRPASTASAHGASAGDNQPIQPPRARGTLRTDH